MIGTIIVAAPITGAALGGLYLAFDLAVLPALAARTPVPTGGGGSPEETAAATMRAINVAILRPSFMALLFGAPALSVAAAVVAPSPLTTGAVALQVAGLAITIAVNVPLNEKLARDDDPGAWSRFVGPWRRAHRVRTAAALGAAALGVAVAL